MPWESLMLFSFAMIPLSKKTLALIDKIISQERRSEVIQILETKVADNLPGLSAVTPLILERFRFAVLRVAGNNPEDFAKAVDLANKDWRDLLVAAEFAHSVDAHEEWANTEF